MSRVIVDFVGIESHVGKSLLSSFITKLIKKICSIGVQYGFRYEGISNNIIGHMWKKCHEKNSKC